MNILLDDKGPYVVLYINSINKFKRFHHLLGKYVRGSVLKTLKQDVISMHVDMTKDKLFVLARKCCTPHSKKMVELLQVILP